MKIVICNIIRLEFLKFNIRKHRRGNNRIIVATGTMHQNTKCRGTNRDTEVDLCDTGMGTIRMATRGRPWGLRRRHRSPRDFVNVSWTQKTRHAGHFPGFFDSQTRRVLWRSFKNTREPEKERRRNRCHILLNNLNHQNLRLMNSNFTPLIPTTVISTLRNSSTSYFYKILSTFFVSLVFDRKKNYAGNLACNYSISHANRWI